MLSSEQIDELLCGVALLDRPALIRQFRSYPAPFPIDFSDEFLRSTDLDRLRHIFVAMCLQCRRLPTEAMPQSRPLAA